MSINTNYNITNLSKGEKKKQSVDDIDKSHIVYIIIYIYIAHIVYVVVPSAV